MLTLPLTACSSAGTGTNKDSLPSSDAYVDDPSPRDSEPATEPSAPPSAVAAATESCESYLARPEEARVRLALDRGISGVDDFSNRFVIVFWHLLADACSAQPDADFAQVAQDVLEDVNSAALSENDHGAVGAFSDELQTTFDRPASVGADFEVTPMVHGQTVVLAIHATGWVARNAAGEAFPGFMVSWGDGTFSHYNDHPSSAECVSQPQYVELDYTYYLANDYPAPGQYQVGLTTAVCTSDSAYDPDEWVIEQTDPLLVGQ